MTKLSVPVLRRGSRGEYVRVVQKTLNLYSLPGIKPLVPDADFGSATDAAVRAFQSKFHIAADGAVGPITRAKLFPFGTYQCLIYATSPSQPAAAAGQVTADPSVPPAGQPPKSPPSTLFAPTTSFSLAPLSNGGMVITDQIPGLTDDLPFPDLPSVLPAFPALGPLFPPLTLPPFPPILPNKIQLAPGNQVSVPKLTILGAPPKLNPFVDTFVTTIRGVWPVEHNRLLHDIEAGATLGLPLSQPISTPKNTTYQFFVQGVSPDLLIGRNMWFELQLIAKAAVTVPKDNSSTTGAVSAQVKASVKLTDSVSASIVAGPQLSGTVASGAFSIAVTPIVANAGVTVSF